MSTVPCIKPITELKNTNAISTLCHEANAPIFITKNGYSDLVIMSVETYERELALTNIFQRLDIAEKQVQAGMPMRSSEDVIKDARNRIDAKI